MKRYWLFIYENCYPLGGMQDFYKDFDTLEECEKEWETMTYKEYHVLDTLTSKVVSADASIHYEDIYEDIYEEGSYKHLQPLFPKSLWGFPEEECGKCKMLGDIGPCDECSAPPTKKTSATIVGRGELNDILKDAAELLQHTKPEPRGSMISAFLGSGQNQKFVRVIATREQLKDLGIDLYITGLLVTVIEVVGDTTGISVMHALGDEPATDEVWLPTKYLEGV